MSRSRIGLRGWDDRIARLLRSRAVCAIRGALRARSGMPEEPAPVQPPPRAEESEWQRTARVLGESTRILRATEARFRAILASVADPLLLVDAEGRIIDASRSVERIFGVTPESLRFSPVSDVLDADYVPRHAAELARVLARSPDAHPAHLEVQCLRADGARFACAVTLARVALPQTSDPLVVETMRDVSESQELHRQLLHAQKMEAIGQLAAGVAHEMNTPIQFVGDNLRFLRDSFDQIGRILDQYGELRAGLESGADLSAALEKIDQSLAEADLEFLREEIPQAVAQSLEGTHRVTEIVRAMKEFSHPGDQESSAIDLNHALRNTLVVARNEWKHVAELDTDFEPGLPQVWGLPAELNQVFLNLIVNAAHAVADTLAPRGIDKGRIRVETKRDGEWAVVRIADSGPGIPEAIRSRIFEPFFTTKRVGQGTGQGLAIAYNVVVEKHGGAIQVDSDPERGTTFSVRLPLGEARVMSRGAAAPSAGRDATTDVEEHE